MRYFTISEAKDYVEQRGIKISRQALHLFVQRNRSRCKQIGKRGSGSPTLWQIPQSLLDSYAPSKQHQQAGILSQQ